MKIMTDFLPSKKDLLNAMAAIAAPVNKAIKKGQESLTDIADWLWSPFAWLRELNTGKKTIRIFYINNTLIIK